MSGSVTRAASWALGVMILLSRPAMTAAQDAAADVQDLVYLAPDRPVFIRLHVRVLAEGFRGLRAAYTAHLFEALDTDGDGVLNATEMQWVPPTDQLLPPRGPNEKPRSINAPPVDADADGSVTLAELTEYVRVSSGPPFAFKPAPSLHAAQVDTYQVLDENRDGVLDESEIRSATRCLLKYDANADEIIDSRELSLSGSRQIVPDVSDKAAELLSVLVVVDPETDAALDALFNRLIEKYDCPAPIHESTGDEPSGNGMLDAGELGVAPDQFAKWDINSDGELEAGEGRRFLLDSSPDLEISVPLGTEEHAAIVSTDQSPNATQAEEVAAVVGPRGDLELTMAGERFDVSLGASPPPRAELLREYADTFQATDRDGNDYLDVTEIRQLGVSPVHFSAVDRNGDGMILKDELLEFAELQSRSFGSRVVLLLSNESQSIIDLVDESGDGELTLRELRQAPEKLLSWDLNGDGVISPRERPDNRRLIIQNGETILFRWDELQNRSAPATARTETGPEWFRKMDGNRDGDVSPREFLGKLETFRRLDADADGLISAGEAEKAESSIGQPSPPVKPTASDGGDPSSVREQDESQEDLFVDDLGGEIKAGVFEVSNQFAKLPLADLFPAGLPAVAGVVEDPVVQQDEDEVGAR